MSEEIKKIEKITDEAQATELTVDDLEQVTGGATTQDITINKQKTADKAVESIGKHIDKLILG